MLSRITNDCGAFWKGILVEGNPSLPQRPNSNQGVAEVKNGAVVEHARVGLGNNGESVEANPLAFSGGIIRADGAFFHNNARSIAFGPYHNKPGRLNLQNESHISRCVFKVDDANRGSLHWNAQNEAAGMYFYQVSTGKEVLHAGKISVLR